MRKLASIVEIESCEPIPESDRLSVATMKGKGWKVVTSRDEFKRKDKAVYFEIDSFLNPNDERYAFLKERCLRKFVSKSGQILREGIKIKTIKLRGVVSQGLLMPLDHFPEITSLIVEDSIKIQDSVINEDGTKTYLSGFMYYPIIGFDATELLKVEHYDEVADQLKPVCGGNPVCADAYGKFPTDFIPKTDEERCQNLGDWWSKHVGKTWEVTSKDDGSSVTMFYSPTIDSEKPFGVCSRNNRLKEKDSKGIMPLPWQMSVKYDIENKLKEFYGKTNHEYALQGELIGPGIQQDRDKYLEHEWHVFKIWDITDQKFLTPIQRRNFCSENNIPHVHVVSESMDVFKIFPTCDDLLKFAEGKTKRGNEREGIVMKCNEDSSLSFKAVSNRYLLKQE